MISTWQTRKRDNQNYDLDVMHDAKWYVILGVKIGVWHLDSKISQTPLRSSAAEAHSSPSTWKTLDGWNNVYTRQKGDQLTPTAQHK